ncbi:linoleoyl-CoA desaturase [Zhouia amylolytica]|uniref:Linoleoyl-CoA desaturase n=2 Tax=Zhouia amylolytica TaxID=376730 RepID=W2ULH8_9FLAO|nr:acyl-CoA desaturase [Zhouia amylolytica]ETN94868.1 linoleoyl-CoA desaturase [Zhouia amylolytica AD3]MCQ0112888.1 acyl-CoA desaturase [Zhouia amylolytica]SFS66770.1 linoleoyl-CoA desaturase [Zhouia amylolytica]
MNTPTIRFSRRDKTQFFKTLNKRVNSYFKEQNIKKTGNWKLYFKTIIMFLIFLTPYFLILTIDMNQWLQLLLTIVIGIGMAGVGMNVMHDGNHGSYSSKPWLNKIMGSSIYILAGNVYNWKVQHNVLHHTYTNIHGHDEDLDAGRIIRFTKHAEWHRFHKFQHYYSVFLYGLLTLNWAITTDFKQMRNYLKRKLSYGKFPSPAKEWSVLVITKIIYMTIWIVLPMLILDIAWWKVLIGFFAMHYTAGLILSIVFQLAHVVEEVETPLPEEDGSIQNTWAIHQLFTTANFSTKNKIVNWFTGGLNHQVEHHIFPNISHIHYTNISKIVRETAKEFNLPYNEYRSTRKAIISHFKHLKELGRKPKMAY